jgi:hypothetical protein
MKLISFGVNGVVVFQGICSGVIMRIQNEYASHMVRIHCMARDTNSTMQTLSLLS